jgi:hypothetical protein
VPDDRLGGEDAVALSKLLHARCDVDGLAEVVLAIVEVHREARTRLPALVYTRRPTLRNRRPSLSIDPDYQIDADRRSRYR